MKEKILATLPNKVFCPNCHKELRSPLIGHGNTIVGSMNLVCGLCKNGKVVIKIKDAQDQEKSV